MELLSPKMVTGYAYNPYSALFPELWLGLQGYWTPALGKTGNYFPDWTAQNSLLGSGATANISQVAQGASVNVTALGASGSATLTITAGTQAKLNITSITPGTAATVNITSSNVSLGTAATVNITASSGAITAVTLATGGSGYVVGQVVPVVQSGGSGGSITVTAVSGTAITTLILNNPGTGYTTASGLSLQQSGSLTSTLPTIVGGGTSYVQAQPLALYPYYGSGCVLSITASSGVVQATPTVTSAGTGYAIGQVLNICQNGGNGATVTITGINFTTGAITSISLTTGGTGYTTATSIATQPQINVTAAYNASAVSSGVITAITLNTAGAGVMINSTCPLQPSGTIGTATVNTAGTQYVMGQVLAITQGPSATATAIITGISTGATINYTVTSGVVQSSGLSVANAGSGYVVGQVLTIQSGNKNSTVTVSSVNGAGAITGLSLSAGGSGYTNGSNTGIAVTWGIITNVSVVGITGYVITSNAGLNVATLPTSGPISGATFATGGVGYYIGQVLTLYQGPSNGATVTVTGITASTGAVTAISFTSAGSSTASYYQTGTALFQNAGQVTTLALNAGGTEYVAGQVLQLQGGGTNYGPCTTAVATIGALGVIATLSPTNPPSNGGSGYAANLTCPVDIVAVGGVVVAVGLANGTVGTFNGGSGYVAGNSYAIAGGTGATVTVDTINSLGQVTALHLTSGGTSGYTSSTSATLAAPGNQTYSVTSGILGGLTINNPGSGYTANQLVTLTQSGSTVTASALVTSVNSTGQITGLSLQNGGSGYSTASVSIGTVSTGLQVTIDYVITNGNVQTGVNANANLTSVLWWTVGQGYHVGQIVNVLGANGSNGSAQITALSSSTAAVISITSVNAAGGITGVSLTTGGTQYIANQVLNVIGGGGTGGMIKVTTVSSGVITAISIQEAGSGYSTGINITVEGAGFMNTGATLTVIDPGTGYSGTLGSGNVAIQTGIITHCTLTTGGSGYYAGQVVPLQQSTTGYGAAVLVNTVSGGAQATYTVSGGVVQATPTIANGGTGYVVGQVLTILAGNNNATLTVSSVSAGVITGWTLSAGGSGYTAGTSNVTFGIATSIILLQGGTGYATGTGVGTQTGNITAVPSINNAGQGYSNNQVLSLYPSSTSVNATFYVYASGGTVQWINVVNGGIGYSVGQILTLQAGSNDACAVVSAVTSGVITAAYLLYGGSSGYTTNTTGVSVSTGATLKVTSINGSGGITSLSLLVPSSGYSVINNLALPFPSGFATTVMMPTFGTFPGGPGSAYVTFTATNGAVTGTPTVVTAGQGYVVGQTLNILQNSLATTATVQVTGVNGINGGITTVSLVSGGANYQTTTIGIPISVSTPVWSTSPSRNGHSINFPSYQSIGWPGITIGQSDSQFPAASTGFTISIFFNTTDATDLLQFFFVGPQGGNNVPGCLALQFDPVANSYNGRFSLAGVFATTGQWDFAANTNLYNMTSQYICNGQWHHLVVTCDPTTNTTTLFIDAQILGTTTGTAFYGLGNGIPMNIGGIGSNQPGNNWYCSDVGIWNRVLTQQEIYLLALGYTPLMPWDNHFSQDHMQYLNLAIGSFDNGFVGVSPYDGQTFLYHNGNLHYWWMYSGTQTWLIDSGANTSMTCQTFALENSIPGISVTISASNDNVNWTTLQASEVLSNSNGLNGAGDGFFIGSVYVWQFNNPTPYRYYRFVWSGGQGNMCPFFLWGKRFVTQNAQYKVPAMTISTSLLIPQPFHGQLFNASPFTITSTLRTDVIAGKIVTFAASPLTMSTLFNHPTVHYDYKFMAEPLTITTNNLNFNIGGTGLSFPVGAITNASDILNVGTKLFIVTDTTPAQLAVVDISSPSSPSSTVHTLTGANNATSIVYNSANGKLYVACANGDIVEVTESSPSTFTVYSSGANGNFTSAAVIPTLDESYFGSDYNTGEVMAFIEAPYSTFGMDIHFSKTALETFGACINTLNGATVATDMRFQGINVPSFGCDVRFLAEDISDLALTPIARTDFHVYVNGTELTDVKLDSIEITHTADEKSMARFVVARKHDQVDYKLDGTYQQLTGQQPVTITVAGNEEFGYDTPAYIWDIDTKSETESVVITAYSELPKQDVRSTVTLSIPSINEKLHIYHALVDNPVIENPFIMPDDPNPPFYQGIVIDTGYQEVQYGTQLTNNFAFGQQTAEQRANWILGSGDSGIYDFDGDSQYFTPLPNYTYFWFVTATNFLTGETLQGTPGTAGSGDGADFSNSLAYIGTSLSPVTSDAWIITDINFWAQRVYPYTKLRGPMPGESIIYNSDLFGVTLFNDSVLRNHSPMTYSGAEIDSMRFALITASNPQNVGFTTGAYNALNASTKLLDVIDSHFGVHFGSAPYKKVSAKNGWKAPTITWEDQSDGLYIHEDAGFNYLGYINQVGALELKKIQNINGTILPKTKCDVELFIDGYYHYSIALLMRLNIDNTTTAGIYNNNNGFPCSVKSIHISAKDMKVTLGCTNAWSRYELLEMEGQMPDPNRYVTFELRQKLCNKLNPATNTTTS